jgi:pyruvate dehydrogenase E2 component (dihydrolipoyllysine-residue acetyltransferase)
MASSHSCVAWCSAVSEFRLPSLGADMEFGTLIEWHVKPGDRVHRGDVVAVVETDKGAIDVEIFQDGVIAELVVEPDTRVPVGAVLARLQDGTETGAPAPAPMPAAAPQTRARAPAPATPSPPPHPPVASPAASRRKISPAARVHAREHGIDLDQVVGSGPGGVVTVADVERLAGTAAHPAPAAAAKRPADAMRRAIGTAMSRSKREIPHYYLAHNIDVEPALRWMETRNAQRPLAQRLLFGALLVKAVAVALQETPSLNGFWRNDAFEPSSEIHVGVVIALRGGGLAAPALRNVDRCDIDSVMTGLRDMTTRARSGRLKSSELGCATVTLSSLGESGVETVFPIIHPPQVAIVGCGAVLPRPWAVDGGLYVRRVVSATLAADHRVSDGHTGAKFLAALQRSLANPEAL